jgi:hypothetical protein
VLRSVAQQARLQLGQLRMVHRLVAPQRQQATACQVVVQRAWVGRSSFLSCASISSIPGGVGGRFTVLLMFKIYPRWTQGGPIRRRRW